MKTIRSYRVLVRVRPEWSLGDFKVQSFDIGALSAPTADEVIEALRERKLEAQAVLQIRESGV